MKVAIYSRVMEDDQLQDVQLFFDELHTQKLRPVVFYSFYDQIKNRIQFHDEVEIFHGAGEITNEIQAIISLAEMAPCSIQFLLFAAITYRSWVLTLVALAFWQALAAVR